MTVGDLLGIRIPFRAALTISFALSFLLTVVVLPLAIKKLRGARVVGRDVHKPGQPEVPEMGGLVVFLAFNAGVFATLAFGEPLREKEALVLSSLVVAAGGCITGILDDLLVLRQRFKAFIPFAFAAPLALYIDHSTVTAPFLGTIDFGPLYPLVLVPLGVACASNGFNMLEGFNGLGAGLGIIIASTLAYLSFREARLEALAILVPLLGALLGFLLFNRYPARIFPGDTMTLLVGAVLASGAIVGGVEVAGALLFFPHIVEFMIKAKNGFPAHHRLTEQGEDGRLNPTRGHSVSLTHWVMKIWGGATEVRVVATLWGMEALLAGVVLLAYLGKV